MLALLILGGAGQAGLAPGSLFTVALAQQRLGLQQLPLLLPADQAATELVLEEIHHWGDDGAETRVEEIAEQSQLNEMVQEAIDEAVQDVVAEAAQAPEIETEQTDDEADLAEDDLSDLSEALTFAHSEPDPIEDDSPEDQAAALAERIAELEAAVGEVDDQWEPDGDGDGGDNAGAPVEAMEWEDADAPETAHDHVWEPDTFVMNDTHMVVSEAEAEPESEPGVAQQIEPDPAPEPEPEPAVDPQLSQNLDPTPELFADSDAVIDEDTLREMVAEIVRRELQGSLGERITRNVRKLVRREIHRALAARELD